MGNTMIVKVQRALYPPDANMMVYNEGRDYITTVPYAGELKKAMGDDLKAFFEVELTPLSFKVLRELPDQGW